MRLLLLCIIACFSCLHAAWIFENGKLKDAAKVATMASEDHFKAACKAYEAKDWDTAVGHFNIIYTNFPGSTHGAESAFFAGVCYYELDELDFANEAFSNYLKASTQPKYFQPAMEYKFCIANEFRDGARRRPFGTKQLPKWFPAQSLALQIYDEVIQTIPCHEYAARSLWFKGNMLREEGQYQASIEAFQTLIRRFPKHELTPKAFLAINQVYADEAEWEFQNPDLLQLAELNLKRFKQEFPRDEKIAEAEKDVQALKETYAAGLWKTGQFYEWQGQPQAAKIYYNSAIRQFPDTAIAEKCKACLQDVKK